MTRDVVARGEVLGGVLDLGTLRVPRACWLAGVEVATVPAVFCEHDLGGRSDEYRRTFAEARRIKRKYASSMQARLRLVGSSRWHYHYVRIALFKLVANSRWGGSLRLL